MMCTIYKEQFKTKSYFGEPIRILSSVRTEKKIDKFVTVG